MAPWERIHLPMKETRDANLIPRLGRSPGEGSGNPLQYSCLENSKDRGVRSLVGYSSRSLKESHSTEHKCNTFVINNNALCGICFLAVGAKGGIFHCVLVLKSNCDNSFVFKAFKL